MKVAFFGAGNMGEPMAANLLRAGYEVTAYNRTRSKIEPLAAAGARIADSPAAAVAGVDAAITMLANDQAVRDTMLIDALSALPAGAVHMCTSTISVALSKELAAAHAAHGQGYVAAPVLGRPEAAAAKQLWVMAAGPKDQIERCRPLMDAIGRGVSVMGEQPWQANLTKIVVNFMIASVLETLGESAALVRKAGMDVHAFLDVVNALFNSPVYANYGKIVADRRFEPAGFRLVLGLKDITLALDAAGGERVPLPLASLIRDRYLDAIAHGQGDADWSALSEVSARHAGIETA